MNFGIDGHGFYLASLASLASWAKRPKKYKLETLSIWVSLAFENMSQTPC
jgi:hypothetical protein